MVVVVGGLGRVGGGTGAYQRRGGQVSGWPGVGREVGLVWVTLGELAWAAGICTSDFTGTGPSCPIWVAAAQHKGK